MVCNFGHFIDMGMPVQYTAGSMGNETVVTLNPCCEVIKVHRSIFSVIIFCTLAFVTACAPKARQVLQNIDFSQPNTLTSVAEITGFSGQESWGRWTDSDVAPAATIRFNAPLPKQFVLVIKGQSMPDHEGAVVRVGSFEQEFFIHGVGDIANIHVDSTEESSVVEIKPKTPASPKELGLNDDARKLGIGLMTVTIEKYEE